MSLVRVVVIGIGVLTAVGIIAWQAYKRRQLSSYRHKNTVGGRAVYFRRDTDTGKLSEEECVICLEDMTIVHRLHSLPCAHTFHQTCIELWARYDRTCPLCRQQFSVQ